MDSKTMAQIVRLRRDGAVLTLFMARRPLNALTADLRAAISAALQAAATDDEITAVVLASDLPLFSAGAQISDAGSAQPGTELAQLCGQIESMPKPVVAAIAGSALGGGLELALAAHARIALSNAQLGLPEVGLGILPSAGATQRLPRLVGAGAALRLMLEPHPITAAQALAIGLVDEVVETALDEKAVAFAENLVAQSRPLIRASDRREGLRDAKAYQVAIATARAKLKSGHLPAPQRLLECVEAAQLLPLDQGLAFERAAFDDLVSTPQARGLHHAFVAESRATALPLGIAAQANPPLNSLAIWGGSELTADVAAQALAAGLHVTLVDPKREQLVKALERIATHQELAVSEGRMSEAARDADWARLRSTLAPEGLAGVDLVLTLPDAGPVPLDPPAAILPLGALPARAGAGRVALQPALAAGLAAELCATADAPAAHLALAHALSHRLGWKLIFTGPGGPIDRRLRAALSAAIAGLEAQGLPRPTIAAALASFGIGVSARTPLPAAPPEAKIVLDACLAALANQAARLITEGVARRPSDVDAAAVLGGIFPRWQGGPMFQADQRGLLVLRADLRHRAEIAPQIYAPDPLFDRLIADGRSLSALNHP